MKLRAQKPSQTASFAPKKVRHVKPFIKALWVLLA